MYVRMSDRLMNRARGRIEFILTAVSGTIDLFGRKVLGQEASVHSLLVSVVHTEVYGRQRQLFTHSLSRLEANFCKF
jgi:hypothetical protein